MSAASDAEEAFVAAWGALSPIALEREHRFHPQRRWRFDFAWPALKLAVEIEGRGRHQTVVGCRKDFDKYNTAVELGWRVLHFPATDYKPSKSRPEWPGGAADWAEYTLGIVCNAH